MGRTRIALLLGSALVALALAAACGGDDEPTLEITTPEDGEERDAGDVQVAVDVTNFAIVDKLGEDPVDGEGHVHFYIDVDDVPVEQGEPAVTEDESTYHAAATDSFTWEDVGAGEHTFAVQLVNNDHTPLDPPVVEEVTVEVAGGAEDGEEPTGTPVATPETSPELSPEVSPEESPPETPETVSPEATSPTSPITTP